MTRESALENLDELGSQGDLGDEKDDGFPLEEGSAGHFEVDVRFSAAGDAMEEFCRGFG